MRKGRIKVHFTMKFFVIKLLSVKERWADRERVRETGEERVRRGEGEKQE